MKIKIEYAGVWYHAYRKFAEEAYFDVQAQYSQPQKIGPDGARRIANEALVQWGGLYHENPGDFPFGGTIVFETEEDALAFLLKFGHGKG